MLTDKNLVCEIRGTHGVAGLQFIYRFKDGHGISVANGPFLYSYPGKWAVAVLIGVDEDGNFSDYAHETELGKGFEVFETDEEVNSFVERAIELFGHP